MSKLRPTAHTTTFLPEGTRYNDGVSGFSGERPDAKHGCRRVRLAKRVQVVRTVAAEVEMTWFYVVDRAMTTESASDTDNAV